MLQNAAGLLNEFLGGGVPGGGQTPARGNPAGQVQGGGSGGLGSFIQDPKSLATGAVAGGLAGLLLGGKKPRKLAKSALKVGGVALVGGLAYKAWQDWQGNKAAGAAQAPNAPQQSANPYTAGQASAPETYTAPTGTAFLPANTVAAEDLSRTLIRAMIAAAKADGHVSEDERARISVQLGQFQLSAEDQAFIEQELAKPLHIDEVARGATCPEVAAEIYAASLLVIDPAGAAERGYLSMLAARLNLDPALVAHLHNRVDGVVEYA